MKRFFLTLAIFTLSAAQAAAPITTQDLIRSPMLKPAVKEVLQKLVHQSRLQPQTEWSESAKEKLLARASISDAEVFTIRANSELTERELQRALKLEENVDWQRARKSRPTTTPNGALYVDFYQESPVLIDYEGEGNVEKNMSFGVVYKYIKTNGVLTPHFVRAQLISTGTSGHRTSIGEFNIDRRHRYYVSQTYGSRMDYAQFFIGGIALHQTDVAAYPKLGGPASHGCVRHHEWDADAMWNILGEALEDGNLVNVKVYEFGAPVVLADLALGTETSGFGAKLNDWLNSSIECTRRDDADACTKSWESW